MILRVRSLSPLQPITSSIGRVANLIVTLEDTLIRLGYNNMSAPNFGPAGQYDSGCAALGMV